MKYDEKLGRVQGELSNVQNSSYIIETMKRTYETLNDYCIKTIPNFSAVGELRTKIAFNEDRSEIRQELSIFMNGKEIQENEQSKHTAVAVNLLNDVLNDIGWGKE